MYDHFEYILGMSSEESFFLSDREYQGTVQIKCFDRRASGCCQPEQMHALPRKMFSPGIAPWIEQWDLRCGLWINRSLSRAFAQRTRNTSQRQVISNCQPTGSDWSDVIDMKGGFLSGL